jgi:drug/metabolite transporter (DMT)-like permease
VAWGGGDFGGGSLSRRAPVFGVVLLSQLTGLLVAAVIAMLGRETVPAGQDLVVCLVAGLLGGVGVTALYRGLAVGRMAIVAPVTGLLAAVIPVIAGVVLQGVPGPLVLAGIALALAAVLLVSRVADVGGGRAGLTEALVAGVAIGLFGVALAGLREGNVFGSFTVIRSVQAVLVVLMIVAVRAPWRPHRGVLPAIVAVGALDMGGNAFYLLAVQSGPLAVASVLSALYPVVTVILAAILLRERVTRDHTVGIALAAMAIVLIGIGSA